MYISHQTHPSELLLIKREQVVQRRRADSIIAEARRQAKKILSAAEKQAESMRREATCEGYETGMLKASHVVAVFFQDWLTIEQQRQQFFLSEVREVLESIMIHDANLMKILDEFIGKCGERRNDHKFELLIPDKFCSGSFIEELRNEKPHEFMINYHHGRRIVMKYDDLIAVFDAEDVVDNLMSHFMQKKTDTTLYQELSESARARLYQELCAEETDTFIQSTDFQRSI